MIQKLSPAIASQFVEVPLADIATDPRNPRLDLDEKELRRLAASMQREQVLQPILVRKLPKSKPPYRIVFGERRFRAAQAAGWSTIPARVVEGMSDAKALVLMGEENLLRQNWNPMELAHYIARLNTPTDQGGAGMKQKEIAQLLGKSKGMVDHLKGLVRLPEAFQRMVASRKITWLIGYHISCYADRPEVLAAVLEDLRENPADWKGRESVRGSMVKAIAERLDAEAAPPEPEPPQTPQRGPGRQTGQTAAKIELTPPPAQKGTLRRLEAAELLKPYAENATDLRMIRDVASDLLLVLWRAGKQE